MTNRFCFHFSNESCVVAIFYVDSAHMPWKNRWQRIEEQREKESVRKGNQIYNTKVYTTKTVHSTNQTAMNPSSYADRINRDRSKYEWRHECFGFVFKIKSSFPAYLHLSILFFSLSVSFVRSHVRSVYVFHLLVSYVSWMYNFAQMCLCLCELRVIQFSNKIKHIFTFCLQ